MGWLWTSSLAESALEEKPPTASDLARQEVEGALVMNEVFVRG